MERYEPSNEGSAVWRGHLGSYEPAGRGPNSLPPSFTGDFANQVYNRMGSRMDRQGMFALSDAEMAWYVDYEKANGIS